MSNKEPECKQKYKDFCRYYIGECAGNAVQSARMAGYSESYAQKKSYLILEQPEVKEYLTWLNAQSMPDTLNLSRDLKQFWFDTMRDEDMDMKHRLRASELLAKAVGEFNDKW